MNSDLLGNPDTLGIPTQAQHHKSVTSTWTLRASTVVLDQYRAMAKGLADDLGVPEHVVHSTALALLAEMHWTQVGDLITHYLEARTDTNAPTPEDTR